MASLLLCYYIPLYFGHNTTVYSLNNFPEHYQHSSLYVNNITYGLENVIQKLNDAYNLLNKEIVVLASVSYLINILKLKGGIVL